MKNLKKSLSALVVFVSFGLSCYSQEVIETIEDDSSSKRFSVGYRYWLAEWELPFNFGGESLGTEAVHSLSFDWQIGNSSFLSMIYTTGSGWSADQFSELIEEERDVERTEFQLFWGVTGGDENFSGVFGLGYHYISSVAPGIYTDPRTPLTQWALETTAHGVDFATGFNWKLAKYLGMFGSGSLGIYSIETSVELLPEVSVDDWTVGLNFDIGLYVPIDNFTCKLGYRWWSIIGAYDEPISADDDTLSGFFGEVAFRF